MCVTRQQGSRLFIVAGLVAKWFVEKFTYKVFELHIGSQGGDWLTTERQAE